MCWEEVGGQSIPIAQPSTLPSDTYATADNSFGTHVRRRFSDIFDPVFSGFRRASSFYSTPLSRQPLLEVTEALAQASTPVVIGAEYGALAVSAATSVNCAPRQPPPDPTVPPNRACDLPNTAPLNDQLERQAATFKYSAARVDYAVSLYTLASGVEPILPLTRNVFESGALSSISQSPTEGPLVFCIDPDQIVMPGQGKAIYVLRYILTNNWCQEQSPFLDIVSRGPDGKPEKFKYSAAAMGNQWYTFATCPPGQCGEDSSPPSEISPNFPADSISANYGDFYSGALREAEASHAPQNGNLVSYCGLPTPPRYQIEDIPAPQVSGVFPGPIVSYDFFTQKANPGGEWGAFVQEVLYGQPVRDPKGNVTGCDGKGYFVTKLSSLPPLQAGDWLRIKTGEGDDAKGKEPVLEANFELKQGASKIIILGRWPTKDKPQGQVDIFYYDPTGNFIDGPFDILQFMKDHGGAIPGRSLLEMEIRDL